MTDFRRVLITVISGILLSAVQASSQPLVCGDVDEDGILGFADIAALSTHLFDQVPLPGTGDGADLDSIPAVTTNDLQKLINVLLPPLVGESPFCPPYEDSVVPTTNDIIELHGLEVAANDSVTQVTVWLDAADTTQGLCLPLAFSCSTGAVVCTGADTTGSPFGSAMSTAVRVDSAANKIMIAGCHTRANRVSPGRYRLASISFAIEPQPFEQRIVLEPTTYPPSNEIVLSRWYDHHPFTVAACPVVLDVSQLGCSFGPDTISFQACFDATFDFGASAGGTSDRSFYLYEGPGSVDAESGIWQWVAAHGAARTYHSVRALMLEELDPIQSQLCSLVVYPDYGAPYIDQVCGRTIAVQLDSEIQVGLPLADSNGCGPHGNRFVADSGGFLVPPYIDRDALIVETSTVDSVVANRTVVVGAADGGDTTFCDIHFLLVWGGCCSELRGNVDYDPLDQVSLGDLTAMIDHLFVSFQDLQCWEEANLDESQPEGPGSISLGDLTVLIDHLFVSFAAPPACP